MRARPVAEGELEDMRLPSAPFDSPSELVERVLARETEGDDLGEEEDVAAVFVAAATAGSSASGMGGTVGSDAETVTAGALGVLSVSSSESSKSVSSP